MTCKVWLVELIYELTVKQEIFACRKFSRVSRIRENFLSQKWRVLQYLAVRVQIRKSSNRRRDFAKFSCREIFLFYSTFLRPLKTFPYSGFRLGMMNNLDHPAYESSQKMGFNFLVVMFSMSRLV